MSRKLVLFLFATLTPFFASADPGPQHFTVRHTELDGIGYNQGYTSLDGFIDLAYSENFLSFADLRLHILNNGDLATNVGFGVRQKLDAGWVWGANLFMDYRNQADFDFDSHKFYQAGFGLEFFIHEWDIRFNAYLPTGQSYAEDVHFHSFQGRNLRTLIRTALAMPGAELDIGRSLGGWKKVDFYGALTPYFYLGKKKGTVDYGDDTAGIKGRVVAQIYDNVGLTVGASVDSVFDCNLLVELAVRFPRKEAIAGMGKSPFAGGVSPANRMGQRVQRNDLIVLQEGNRVRYALCPVNCEPYQVIHVSNNGIGGDACGEKAAPASPDGSWEHPFTTLADAESASSTCDIIYVHVGNGSTGGLNTGITLKNYQQLLGAGKGYTIESCQGFFHLPAMCQDIFPKISNGAGAAVTLADHNTVAGLWIDAPSGRGISAAESDSAQIFCNKITGSGSDGIFFDDPTGEIYVTDNTIYNAGANGIYILKDNEGEQKLKTTIYGNTIRNTSDSGILLSAASQHMVEASIDHNLLSDIGSRGIQITLNDSCDLTARLSDNKMTGVGSDGVFLDMNNFSTASIDFSCNKIFDAGANGIGFSLSHVSELELATLSKNTIEGASSHGVGIVIEDSAEGYFCLHKNCIADAGSNGIDVDVDNSGKGHAVIDENEIARSGSSAVNIDCDDLSFFGGAFGYNILGDTFIADTEDSARLDLQLIRNVAPGYTVTNGGGTVNFENTAARNTGPFTFSGDITFPGEDILNLRGFCP